MLFNLTINVSPQQICAELEKPSHPVPSNSDFLYNMDNVHIALIEVHVRDAVFCVEKMAKISPQLLSIWIPSQDFQSSEDNGADK